MKRVRAYIKVKQFIGFQLPLLFTTILSSILITSCVTPKYMAQNDLKIGMEKAEVLDIMGGPNRTSLRKGKEFWLYIYYKGKERLGTVVVFQKGYTIAIRNHSFEQQSQDDLLHAETYEEYVKSAKERKERNKDEYKELEE